MRGRGVGVASPDPAPFPFSPAPSPSPPQAPFWGQKSPNLAPKFSFFFTFSHLRKLPASQIRDFLPKKAPRIPIFPT